MKRRSHLLLLCLLLCGIASCLTPRKGPRRALEQAASMAPFDVLIVPGTPFNGRWDTIMKARVLWSWILYKNGIVKNIIYSGAAVYSPYKESVIMGLYGQALGIPARHIFYDTLARHSTENIYYSYLLAKKLGFRTIALGTDPFQAFTLRGYIRKRFATPIYTLPFYVDSLEAYNHIEPEIRFRSSKEKDWTSIREQQSFFRRFRGTLGKDIQWHQYEDGKVGPLGN